MFSQLLAFFRNLPPTPKVLAGRYFVLDGTNITLIHGPKYPQIRYVLAIGDYLLANGGTFECFFDANTRYIIQDHSPEQLAVFEKLTREEPWTERFHVVPSGTEADQWILAQAKRDGADVISNDQFRDRAKENRWIWKRRHSMYIDDRCMRLASLGAKFEVLASAESYLQRSSLSNG
ncbi:MAG: hypothetical protein ACI87W_000993 [Halieaceae bacterium]